MLRVTSDWLNERGDLHDATVTNVRFAGTTVEFAVNDEWFNSRGLDLPEGEAAPGALVVEDYSEVAGKPTDAVGGWLYEVRLRDNEIELQFCDREVIRLRAGSVWWRS